MDAQGEKSLAMLMKFAALAAVGGAIALLTYFQGRIDGANETWAAAFKAGVAEYNSLTGKRQFLPPCPPPRPVTSPAPRSYFNSETLPGGAHIDPRRRPIGASK